MLGVGAVATLTSAAILLGTFAYVALYALLYRITPVVLLWTGYHLLTDPVDFCAARGPWCALSSFTRTAQLSVSRISSSTASATLGSTPPASPCASP